MECLDANLVQDLMSGSLDDGARATVMGHLDGCADCRDLLGAVARTASIADARDRTNAADPALAQTQGVVGETNGTSTLASLETRTGKRARSLSGQSFGRYHVLERLGAGAMGVVYRAEDPELGRQVALKLLHRPDTALTERLVREARSMAQVNHPNVVTVFDVGVANGSTYLAMELVAGKSLREWQADKKNARELTEAYIAAGQGLAAAHAAGIVHRDFKPDNVIVGDDGRVRVTDFGLAAAQASGLPSPVGDLALTTEGSVLGTPAYMAPEQFVGGNVDARTDQFNFCVALYEALYNRRPFAGKTFNELGDNVCEGKVRPAPSRTHVSNAVHEILLKGLSVRPGDRFATMDHLLVELGRDRAKPWRRTAIASAVVATILALGLVSDLIIRDRTQGQIHEAFKSTGRQIQRETLLLAGRFEISSKLANQLPVLRSASAQYDQADFGLSTDPKEDQRRFDDLHAQLASAEFDRDGGTIVVIDYKGRLLYSSAAPGEAGNDLSSFQLVTRTLAQDTASKSTVVLLPNNDPLLVAAHAGPTQPGLSIVFVRAVVARVLYMALYDATQILEDVSLEETGRPEDKATKLALVAPDGTIAGDLPPELVAAALTTGETEVRYAGSNYEVQARPMKTTQGEEYARVVMARRIDTVLSLFPGARLVFALALVAAIILGVATAWRARQVTGANV